MRATNNVSNEGLFVKICEKDLMELLHGEYQQVKSDENEIVNG